MIDIVLGFTILFTSAVITILIDWLLKGMLPEKPTGRHAIAGVIGLVLLGFLTALLYELDKDSNSIRMPSEVVSLATEPPSVTTNTSVPIVQTKNTPTPTTTPCQYHDATDKQTFVNLIQMEEQAVLTEDIELIQSIFSPDALIRVSSEDRTDTVLDHYQQLFESLDFIELTHFGFDLVQKTNDKAWMKVSDTGKFFVVADNRTHEYTSDPGAAHFTFETTSSGCWQIVHFAKGAANDPFP